MADVAKALWIVGEGRAEIRAEPLAAPGPGDVVLRMLVSGVSRGTERLVLAGRVPADEAERMACPHQGGRFPFPVKYGYMAVGVVEAGPADLVGRTVFALAPHQDRIVLPAGAVIPVPEAVPARRAVLAANMETALNVVWDAGIAPGDRVLVVGAGVVGLLVGRLAASIPGTEVALVDVDPARRTAAAALGLALLAPDEAPRGCDVCVNASASAAGLAVAIGAAGPEATVVEASWYGAGAVPVPLGGTFHSQRLRIVASQVGRVPAERRSRWTHRRRLAKALDLLADPRLDALVASGTPFREAAEAYPRVIADPATLAHVFAYEEE
jgi:2-desacetyl-2-hydroxyethyl bacteriochlorophyllide A dehydrogenase